VSPETLGVRTAERVHSAMTIAMRADPVAIAAALESPPGGLGVNDLPFLRAARPLTVGFAAALTAVLGIHRYRADPYNRTMCLSCGTPDCRTLHSVAEALAAYGISRPEVRLEQLLGVER
jgi:hypothetical protein